MSEALKDNARANCATCGLSLETFKLRPYGPGGSLICHPCGMKPAYRAIVDAHMRAIFGAPGHTIQTPTGMVKSTATSAEELMQQAKDLNDPSRRN